MGVVQALSSVKNKVQQKQEATAAKPENLNKLCFVETVLRGKVTMGLIDSGATHNYLSAKRAKELGMDVQPGTSSFKAVNSPARKVAGVVRDALVKVGMWQGRMTLMVIEMDDFELILGQEFLRKGRWR